MGLNFNRLLSLEKRIAAKEEQRKRSLSPNEILREMKYISKESMNIDIDKFE